MNPLFRAFHVLAVALWFGSVTFFTFAGLLIFDAFKEVSLHEANDRPAWLPLPELYAGTPPEGFPSPLRQEQGSRAAGVAVSRIFPVYYGLQTGCGIVVLLTAVLLARAREGTGHSWRLVLAVLALATVLGGWWLEGEVSRLRHPRNDRTDSVLQMPVPSEEAVRSALDARATFGRWHGYSLLQNFATLMLSAGLTVLVPALCRSTGTSKM